MLNSTRAVFSGQGGDREDIPPSPCRFVTTFTIRLAALPILAISLIILGNLLVPQLLHAQAAKGLSKEDIVKLLDAEVASRRIEALV